MEENKRRSEAIQNLIDIAGKIDAKACQRMNTIGMIF